ncbi:MAG: nitroreductase family protein [Dehalococcoidia bacterium]|nr:nitroreductase family protein [Dehalococcoidia bacterium]
MSDEPGLFEVMYTNRAMRRLKPDPVPEELLLKLIDAANQAPSGSNQQNGRWIVVRDPEQKAKLAELNKKAVTKYLQSQRKQSVPHHDDAKRQRMLDAVEWQADHMHEMPALVIACLELGGEPPESFFAGAASGGSIWPGVQNLLLAARALGLGAAPTTLALSDRAAAKDVLGLPATVEAFCLVPVGYPRGNFGPVTRRPVEEILRWDRWE